MLAALKFIDTSQPPDSDPTTEPVRPAALAQLTPVARLPVG